MKLQILKVAMMWCVTGVVAWYGWHTQDATVFTFVWTTLLMLFAALPAVWETLVLSIMLFSVDKWDEPETWGDLDYVHSQVRYWWERENTLTECTIEVGDDAWFVVRRNHPSLGNRTNINNFVVELWCESPKGDATCAYRAYYNRFDDVWDCVLREAETWLS